MILRGVGEKRTLQLSIFSVSILGDVIYVLVGVIGLLVAAPIGLALLLKGSTVGGWVLTAAGVVGTAVGLIGFGFAQHREKTSPARRLADEEARERLAEREKRRLEEEAREAERRRIEDRRLAQLRDLGRIRRAIIAELGKLMPGTWLTFGWGERAEGSERHAYRLTEDGRLELGFKHRATSAAWVWEEGGYPLRHDATSKPDDPTRVDEAYKLIQLERHLVRENLPAYDQLELPDPGYGPYQRAPE